MCSPNGLQSQHRRGSSTTADSPQPTATLVRPPVRHIVVAPPLTLSRSFICAYLWRTRTNDLIPVRSSYK